MAYIDKHKTRLSLIRQLAERALSKKPISEYAKGFCGAMLSETLKNPTDRQIVYAAMLAEGLTNMKEPSCQEE